MSVVNLKGILVDISKFMKFPVWTYDRLLGFGTLRLYFLKGLKKVRDSTTVKYCLTLQIFLVFPKLTFLPLCLLKGFLRRLRDPLDS